MSKVYICISHDTIPKIIVDSNLHNLCRGINIRPQVVSAAVNVSKNKYYLCESFMIFRRPLSGLSFDEIINKRLDEADKMLGRIKKLKEKVEILERINVTSSQVRDSEYNHIKTLECQNSLLLSALKEYQTPEK